MRSEEEIKKKIEKLTKIKEDGNWETFEQLFKYQGVIKGLQWVLKGGKG